MLPYHKECEIWMSLLGVTRLDIKRYSNAAVTLQAITIKCLHACYINYMHYNYKQLHCSNNSYSGFLAVINTTNHRLHHVYVRESQDCI